MFTLTLNGFLLVLRTRRSLMLENLALRHQLAVLQNPYVERLIGTLRRECLEHVVVLNETYLRRLRRDYLAYYHSVRTHLSLEKDSPEPL